MDWKGREGKRGKGREGSGMEGRKWKGREGNGRYLVEPVGINGYNFRNERLYLSFTAIITIRLVGCINMSRNRLVNIVIVRDG